MNMKNKMKCLLANRFASNYSAVIFLLLIWKIFVMFLLTWKYSTQVFRACLARFQLVPRERRKRREEGKGGKGKGRKGERRRMRERGNLGRASWKRTMSELIAKKKKKKKKENEEKTKQIHRFWAALAIVSGDWRRLAEFLHVLLGLACVWRCNSSPVPFRYVLQICFVKMTREIEAPSGLDDVSSACWARSSFTLLENGWQVYISLHVFQLCCE